MRTPPLIPKTVATRSGKILVLLAVMLPAVLGVLGLLIDGSRLMTESQVLQQAADAAALAAATSLAAGESSQVAASKAEAFVLETYHLTGASVNVQIPPLQGPYAGKGGFAEVHVNRTIPLHFIQAVRLQTQQEVHSRAVAGKEAATAGAAMVVLDPSPPSLQLPAILGLTLPALPSHHLGGLEVLGIGKLRVNGAVLVNNDWGGFDEDGELAGKQYLIREAVSCTPLLPLTKLTARDLRVVGGVDNPKNYGAFESGKPSPLRANALPVPDPFRQLPVPTTSSDPVNVKATLRGGVIVAGLPLIGPPVTLNPGVYEYIQIISGRVTMNPGVYIIRGRNPLTSIPLQVIGGEVSANGVMFYITDSGSYSPATGSPDAADGETQPPATTINTDLVSAVVNFGLLGSTFTPLNDPSSPFHGMLFYQRRTDRRIAVFARDTLLSDGSFSGTIYAKWGHLVVVGMGTFNTRFVVGSMRMVNVLDCTIQPTSLLPPADDVFLVQ